MTSKLIVNSIRHTGASADAITLDSSGNVTFPANATCSGTATGFGKILQIVQSQYTSNISYNSTTTYADTGLTCNITTASSGHGSVLCLVQGHLGALANGGEDAYAQMNLVRGSTQIGTAFIGAFAGNVGSASNDPTTYQNAVINELDDGTSGGTTYTYKVQFKKLSNAQQAAWNAYNGPSTITLIEIAS